MAKKKTDYERIRKYWYDKLKEEGFVDIEYADGSLNIGHPRSTHYEDPELRQIALDYNIMAIDFLNTYVFANKLEHIVWEYHTEGFSVRDISSTLAKINIKINKDKVWKIIDRLEKRMKRGF